MKHLLNFESLKFVWHDHVPGGVRQAFLGRWIGHALQYLLEVEELWDHKAAVTKFITISITFNIKK